MTHTCTNILIHIHIHIPYIYYILIRTYTHLTHLLHTGIRMRKEIEEKIDKLHEAPKARIKKALPVPEEKSKKKRGGKRV